MKPIARDVRMADKKLPTVVNPEANEVGTGEDFSPQRALNEGVTLSFKIPPAKIEWGIKYPNKFNDWVLQNMQRARIALMEHVHDWHRFYKEKYEQEQEEKPRIILPK